VFAAAAALFLAPSTEIQGVQSQSGELRIFATRSIATVLEKVGGEFELRSGRKLAITTDMAARMVRRIDAGEPFDFLVAAPVQMTD
jgi:ABC-type molybdate transport system substrate-binding protein